MQSHPVPGTGLVAHQHKHLCAALHRPADRPAPCLQNQRAPYPLLSDKGGVMRKALGIKGNLFGVVPGREVCSACAARTAVQRWTAWVVLAAQGSPAVTWSPAAQTFVISKEGKLLHRFNDQLNATKHVTESLRILESQA